LGRGPPDQPLDEEYAMNAETTANQAEPSREPPAELSAAERAVAARIQNQAAKTRTNAVGEWLKSPPLFFIPIF